jgi:16S rRNA (guanine966-N2)-methyltransferase
MTGSIRIIGGNYKGKKIPVLSRTSLRPTPNRVRETLFNWLMHDISQAVCLDAFAGSGALGLEALSRGAKNVVFIEQDPAVYQHLKKTIATFLPPTHATQQVSSLVEVLNRNALDYLKHSPLSFDIIFLDPPFQSNDLAACLKQLTESKALSPQGILYIESNSPPPIDPAKWCCLRSQHAGSVYYGLYQWT